MIALQHQAYQKWLKDLNFYEDELILFHKELDLLISRQPDILSIIEHVEEYQQIFKKKKLKLKGLQDLILNQEHNLRNQTTLQENQEFEFEKIKKQFEKFIVKLEKLKKNFRRFVAKNMF